MKQLKQISTKYINMGISLVFMGLLILFINACEDTFEEDISKDTVELLTPQDGYSFIDPNITFWWNPVSGARDYSITIIQIDTNNNPVRFVMDSVVLSNQFEMTLSPGVFEWGITAYNAGYQTETFYSTFSIDSTLDISSSSVRLLSPANNWITNSNSLSFTWSQLYNADKYTLEINSPDENGSNAILLSNLTSLMVDTNLATEGNYAWTVYASNNETGSTSQKEWRYLLIDRTDPALPDLLRPIVDDTLRTEDLEDNKIRFSWDKLEDSGSDIEQYNLEISTDSSTVHSTFAVNDTFYLWSPLSNQKLFWRVNAVDAAENEGDFTNWRRFFQE
jgi:hypothetical protein